MITYGYFALLGLSCLLALSNWRKAVYAAIALDFLRDPVRKLDQGESVLITVSVLGLWGVIMISAWGKSQREIHEFFRFNPRLLQAFRLLLLAILPGCVISLIFYSGGYRLVALGLVSYLAPFAGVLLGVLFAKDPVQMERVLRFYCVVNGIALTSVIAEYTKVDLPALGGMRDMNWIRYSGSEIVNLIGGFYRSPDIMGLHAAQVVMFSMILATRRNQGLSIGWLALALFGSLCLLLSGRRKMLGMPLVFMAATAFFCYLRGIRYTQFAAMPVIALSAAAAGVYLVGTDDFVADEYTNFATTLFTDGVSRSQQIVAGSVASTLSQSGVIGSGIGSATQGAYHVSDGPKMGWQEDGVSRLFKELGIIGVVLAAFAITSAIRAVTLAVRRTPRASLHSLFQLMLIAVVVANAASFMISHQQYSGDPPSAIIVLMVLGMGLSVAIPYQKVRRMSKR